MSFGLDTIKNFYNKKQIKGNYEPGEFEKKYSIDKRIKEVNRLNSRYPDRIPIIVYPSDNNQPNITKNKFLVPTEITVSQFIYVIKNYIKLEKQDAIFVFTKQNTLVPSSWNIHQLYKEHKANDNFLYLYYSIENTFG